MKRAPLVTVIDFETDPIQARPKYPPAPVGVSILPAGEKKARYYAWGHPAGNNCTKSQAQRALKLVWGDALLFQNAKFDIDVAQTHMGMGPVREYHDTMFLLFLHDPHAPDLKLKEAAERILGEAPYERDVLKEWVMSHKKQIEEEFGFKFTPKDWGGAIAYAPGDIVGSYANGDSTRTLGLFKYLWPRIVERGMQDAYQREIELMPILLENERVGLRVDVDALRRDVGAYLQALEAADVWLRKRLKVGDLNLDNDGEIAAALSGAGIIADEDWAMTATGRRSVSKKFLLNEMFKDQKVASVLGYRNRLTTCLKMFMQPWLIQAEARPDRHISTNWNQVRQPRGTSTGGTRTGRPSTADPNFLNLSKTWDNKDDGFVEPSKFPRPFLSVAPLPLVRKYILPDKGETFCHRDYNGQELRILGHYEDGALLRAYQEDPTIDVHQWVAEMIEEHAGLTYERHQVKVTNFRRIYGGGAPAMAQALHVSLEAAKQLLKAHGKALPGLGDLQKQIKALSDSGEPIVTYGGREYYVEPPGYSERFKRHMTYEFKLLNYLIQGSAADITKQAIIDYNNHPKRTGRFLVTVYDEINVSAKNVKHEMQVLRECMEAIPLDVLMLSDGKTGPSWGELAKYVDPL